MRIILSFSILCFLIACSSRKPKTRDIGYKSQWDTLRVLKNPHKGWYHHLLDNGIENYAVKNDSIFSTFPAMDHLYLRLAWSYLEPKEGDYDWHRIDEIVEKYVPQGYGISFRITSKETGNYPGTVGQQEGGVQFATPVWVKNAGAKGVVTENGGIKSWTPDWDDPVYLEKLANFHKVFAKRYDEKPWLRYIDIGSIGEWGEGHTHFSTQIPPTVAEVKANVDVYLKNYKRSQLICTDDLLYYRKPDNEVKELYEYAVSKGISLRDDSPLVDWYMINNLHTWSVSHPQFYDPLYLKKPIVFELQHYGVVKADGNWIGKNGEDTIVKFGYSGADVLRKAIETMHATYIGYHGYAEEWLNDNPELTNELANRCGYWYFPVKAVIPEIFKKGENTFSVTWLNKGVAPAYNSFGLALRFKPTGTENETDIFIEESGNSNWLPETERTEKYLIILPENLVKGTYLLQIKFVEKSANQLTDVHIGINTKYLDHDNYFTLETIKIE